jgi:hypothetical protein
MAAKKKSASRRAAAKTKMKKATPKKPAAKKKAVAPKRQAPRKKSAQRKKPAPAPKVRARRLPAPSPSSAALVEIDQRIAIAQNNLRDLTEQATATSGSATEELLSDRIATLEAELKRLRQERDTLARG